MKRIWIVVLLINIISSLFLSINVMATSGAIKQSSVIKCGDKYYGSHGNPKHFHIVEKENGKWVSVSKEVDEPECYADKENEKEEVTLSKCVDGDTAKFVMENGEIKTARFLAIDTPESVHPTKKVEEYGKEASNYTCNLLTNAKKIILEYDKNSDKEDKYGRVLAFVYADSLMVQKELLEVGYAKVAYLYADYTYTDELQKIELDAKNRKVGIWSNEVSTLMEENEEINETNNQNKEKDKLFDVIWNFIKKIVSNLFDYLESML